MRTIVSELGVSEVICPVGCGMQCEWCAGVALVVCELTQHCFFILKKASPVLVVSQPVWALA